MLLAVIFAFTLTGMTAAETFVTYEGNQLSSFKNGAGIAVELPLAMVATQVTIEFDSFVCQTSPAFEDPVERELCLDLSPTKCDGRCSNGTAYAIDDAVSFVTLFVVRASQKCDKDANTRVQCQHANTEGNRMLLSCPRELISYLLVRSPFLVKSVTVGTPEYPRSWVAPDWQQDAGTILKNLPSISLSNSGTFFELSGPDAFPVLMANLPKPTDEPPCHQNVFMAGVRLPTANGSGRLLALSTTQHYDTRNEDLLSGSIAWLAGADSSSTVTVDHVTGSTIDASKQVFVWRVPNYHESSSAADDIESVVTHLTQKLLQGRGVLIFFGEGTRWPVVERFLDSHGMHFTKAEVAETDRQLTLSNRIANRLLRVYKSLRVILTDMAKNELHWDRNPTFIRDKKILTRNCRDDVRLKTGVEAENFQALLGRALCNNKDIVSFAPCTFHQACQDNTCGAALASGRPCFNKLNHFGFINQLLNFLTKSPACLTQYDTAGVHPGPVRNLAARIGNYRVRVGKSAAPPEQSLSWNSRLTEAGLAYGDAARGARRDLLSTGVYLPALTKARVKVVSARPSGSSLQLTVGHNLDVMAGLGWYGERSCQARPWLDMAQTYPLSEESTHEVELFSPFGGLIHVLYGLPSRVTNYDTEGISIELEFRNVVQAPYVDFKLAAASPRQHLADASSPAVSPAPWGEFRSGFAILGAPRSGFSRVDGNTLIAMRFIERTARLSVLIGGPNYRHWRLQGQQRVHSDTDLQCLNVRCRGYSGNPLYIYVDMPSDRHNTDSPFGSLLDGAALEADRVPNSHDVFYHELGHNYSPVSLMFGIENREVAADFLLVVLRRYLHNLDLTNSPFLLDRYYNHQIPVNDRSLCQSATSFDWTRVPTTGTDLVDLFPALIVINYFGLDVLADAQRMYFYYYAREPLQAQHRTRAASAVFSNITGYNLQPIFAFFNYPIDPSLTTGQPSFDQLLAQESHLPAFFPGQTWVARCLPDRLRSIEQRFGGKLVLGDSPAAESDLFKRAYFTEESPHLFSRERLRA
ncbi:hypothetical protein BOX15_Mlig032974g1 [Macrostomum lignano]|uniref:Peptidase M60 domain-containing protein n=1 Tax=Macrostomum lignano TaxID=282301 RepID=A0A267E664_9PLAT|nr:hypothetical protein BOX15_Mlig032974g1 [Macrostomum lignano]